MLSAYRSLIALHLFLEEGGSLFGHLVDFVAQNVDSTGVVLVLVDLSHKGLGLALGFLCLLQKAIELLVQLGDPMMCNEIKYFDYRFVILVWSMSISLFFDWTLDCSLE